MTENNLKEKHIVSFSGGKDSTALILMMLEKERESNYHYKPIDEIIFCDTGKEFPEIYRHIDKIEKDIGIPITRLKSDKSFDYYMFEHIKTKGKQKGEKGYGWSDSLVRWCTSFLKKDVMNKYYKENYKDYKIVEYIGIAYDEFKRYGNNSLDLKANREKIYPLIDWKITEGMALKYCYDKGYDWEGLYTHFDRVSCWCCPLKNQRELYMLYSFYPELWAELKDMDSRAWNQFKKDYSVQDLEDKFKEFQIKLTD